MICIMGEKCDCRHNSPAGCKDEPFPDGVPCVGTVCWNYEQRRCGCQGQCNICGLRP